MAPRANHVGFVSAWMIASLGAAGVSGCVPDPVVSFDSPAPAKRLDAIARASRDDDTRSLERLVEMLGSVDPVERMLSIRALEAREGVTLGYDHASPAWERLEAIGRWRERLGMVPLSDGDGGAGAKAPMNNAEQDAGAPGGGAVSDGGAG